MFFFNSIQNITENSMILSPFLLILWKAGRMRVVNNWQRKGGDNAYNTGTLACHSWSLQLSLFIIIWLWIFYVYSTKATQLSTMYHPYGAELVYGIQGGLCLFPEIVWLQGEQFH